MSGRLIRVDSPLQKCVAGGSGADCAALFKALKNPFFIGDQAGLTQTLGWVDAWTSQPSAYAIAAVETADVIAGVNFARQNSLRLVVKGGGHSYQGTSNAPDSLLIWTRKMNAVSVEEAFVAAGCEGSASPQRAVTVGAGAMWGQVYDRVMKRARGYVQGGGCLTVGVAGLIMSGGFGSFSKGFGLAAASLLQAEIVTADGVLRVANACTHPDLFWALKGGGGGSLGVVTQVTLRVHPLPQFVGTVSMKIQASSEAAYRRLIGLALEHYRKRLFDPHWGEQMVFEKNNTLRVAMLFQGLDQAQATEVWQAFRDALAAEPGEFRVIDPMIFAIPADKFWDAEVLKRFPGVVIADDRPGAAPSSVFWAGDQGETGQVLHGYRSAWLPASLLEGKDRERLVGSLFAATRHWPVALHFNKGLAGAPAAAIDAALDCVINPAVTTAFALAISGAEEPPAYPNVPGHEPHVKAARQRAAEMNQGFDELARLTGDHSSYVAEADYFERDWQQAFWGANYPRLLRIKDKYDPDGLFFVRHGVGSERWSDDGFDRTG